MFTFRLKYFLLTLLLLLTEILIALYLNDRIIRPYVGDLLVVILVYCFLRSFFTISIWQAAIGSLLFAYLVEFLQYLNIIQKFGLQHSRLANVVLGNLFEWIDIVAYTLGIIIVLLVEKLSKKRER